MLLIRLIVSCGIFLAVHAQYRATVCKKGQQICSVGTQQGDFSEDKDECYSPGTQVCLNDTKSYDQKYAVICPKGTTTLCNSTCVPANSKKICIGNSEALCDAGQALCAGRCYSNKTSICIGDYICAKGEEVCGKLGCYSPKTKKCFESEGQLCDIGKVPPCKGTEARAKASSCKKEESKLCGSQCYDPAKLVCLSDKKLCPLGHSLCGDTCYNEAAGDKCHSGVFASDPRFVCSSGTSRCAKTCYAPATHLCIDDYYVCLKGQQLCGGTCFNNVTHHCLPGRQGMGPGTAEVVCPIGQLRCGDDCYHPKNKSVHCIKGSGGCGGNSIGKLCPVGQSRCGSICYDSKSKETVCLEAEETAEPFICPSGSKVCHNKCYNPKNDDCFKVETGAMGEPCQVFPEPE